MSQVNPANIVHAIDSFNPSNNESVRKFLYSNSVTKCLDTMMHYDLFVGCGAHADRYNELNADKTWNDGIPF